MKTLLLTLIFCGVLLTSCGGSNTININHLIRYKMGDQKSNVAKIIDGDINEYSTDFGYNNEKYTAVKVRVTNFQYREFFPKKNASASPTTTAAGTGITATAGPMSGSTSRNDFQNIDPFFLIFKNNTLVLYGYPYEFITSSNPEWNKLWDAALQELGKKDPYLYDFETKVGK